MKVGTEATAGAKFRQAVRAYGSISSGSRSSVAPISSTGMSAASWAISRLFFISDFPPSLSM